MTKTFTLKLNTELPINFKTWGLSDAEQRGGSETKRLIINHFLEQRGLEEFEIAEKNNTNLVEVMAQVAKAQRTHLKPLIVHASECHMLMTNPRRKSDELAETTKTWLKEKAVEQVLGLRKTVATKPMIKGTVCEQKSIDLFNQVMLTQYTKNNVTKEKNGFAGTPDLLGKEEVVEIKTSWDATTFPFFKDEVDKRIKKSGYDWQCRVYMMLFGLNKSFVSYCLVDTPRETANGDVLLNRWDDWTLHRFDGKIDPQKRVTISEVIKRDETIEQKMVERYEIANRYYQDYLEEIYKK